MTEIRIIKIQSCPALVTVLSTCSQKDMLVQANATCAVTAALFTATHNYFYAAKLYCSLQTQ